MPANKNRHKRSVAIDRELYQWVLSWAEEHKMDFTNALNYLLGLGKRLAEVHEEYTQQYVAESRPRYEKGDSEGKSQA